jgi:hypothetical protein
MASHPLPPPFCTLPFLQPYASRPASHAHAGVPCNGASSSSSSRTNVAYVPTAQPTVHYPLTRCVLALFSLKMAALCVLQAPPPLNLIHKLLFLPTYICLRAVCGRCWAKWCVVHPTHLSTCAAHLCTERIVPMVGTGGLRSRRRQHMALRRRSASRSRSDCKHVSSGLRESSSVTALTKMHTPPS